MDLYSNFIVIILLVIGISPNFDKFFKYYNNYRNYPGIFPRSFFGGLFDVCYWIGWI